MLYIVDIDGTVADCSHRLHFIQSKPKNWKAFYAACTEDLPIQSVIDTVNELSWGGQVVFSTGRSEECRGQTTIWLREHGVNCDGLYMRKEKDYREDYIVKAELLKEIEGEFGPVTGVFEDRQQVVDMYRSKGIKVFQVADGKF